MSRVQESRGGESEDEILAAELAALGAASGGSGRLTRLVAKAMRKNVHEIDLVMPLPFDEAVKRVAEVLGRAGRAGGSMPVEHSADQETVRVVTGGGFGGLNPVVVTALVTRSGTGGANVRLRAAAKEGLIKQRAGEKTAARLAASLSE
ncbi:hypothetical protein [Streptomyces afghaniensis]|uniref:hypothetical protein n=1 Tax=Streptomyces afghaniensis TaxID=66865 RepID=UPI00277E9BB9|nr:hypothetical protein [Streptomyces afghaniensis]MDQ1016177.1 hypothetical protein [Streptomyces afghaniensis]